MSERSPIDIVMGRSGPPVLKPELGVWCGGRIVGFDRYIVREYDPNKPGGGEIRRFPSGDPIEGVWFDVDTGTRNSPDDDGVRRLYVEKQRMLKAIAAAVSQAGRKAFAVNDSLFVCWTGTERTDNGVDANTYSANYTPSAATVVMAQAGPVAPQQFSQPIAPPPPIPGVAFGVNTTPPPTWATAAPVAPQAVPAQQHVTPVPATAGPPVITASVAAAMANAGIDTSAYTVVPD